MDFDFANWWLILRRIVAEPFRPKRKAFLFAVFVGLTLVSVVSFVCLLLDHVLFPGFRKVEIRAPAVRHSVSVLQIQQLDSGRNVEPERTREA